MLDILNEGFKKAKTQLAGKAVLTEENMSQALAEVQRSLLEADVEYNLVKNFVKKVKEDLEGETVQLKAGRGQKRRRVSPSEHFIAACQKELEALMGPEDARLKLPENRVGVIMMAGLQGSGKTTSTAKLTKYLIETHKRKPLLVAADIYRPAAVDQLKVLGERLGVPVFFKEGLSPVELAQEAIKEAYATGRNVVIIDTAGRLAIDEKLMQELRDIKETVHPDNILYVCDAMMGQDAVTTAKSFHEQLEFSGIIMTKLDGDARGGAALSIKAITGKPIKFLGMGEDIGALEPFRPQGLASRILGMGDVVGLMHDFERVAEEDQQEQALKMLKGQFTFDDFYKQISMIQKMGSVKDIAAKLPMQDLINQGDDLDDRELVKIKSMIDSMTKEERLKPGLLNPSRVQRIAKGSGRSTQDVQGLIQQFSQLRKIMNMLGKSMGLLGKIPGVGAMKQMRNLAALAQSGDFSQLLGGLGGASPMRPAPKATKPKFDREKVKKLRKQARKQKRKNRKRK